MLCYVVYLHMMFVYCQAYYSYNSWIARGLHILLFSAYSKYDQNREPLKDIVQLRFMIIHSMDTKCSSNHLDAYSA